MTKNSNNISNGDNVIINGEEKRPDKLSDPVPNFSLPGVVSRFVKTSPSSPYLTDYDYFESILACETARILTYRLRTDLAHAIFNPSSDSFAFFSSGVVRNGRQLGNLMENLTKELDSKQKQRLRATEVLPLVEAFLDGMDATEWERKIFRNILATNSGMIRDEYGRMLTRHFSFSSNSAGGDAISDKIDFFQELFPDEFSLPKLLALVQPGSKWVKELIYTRTRRPSGEMSAMSDDMIRAFMGAEISLSKFQALESSTLQKALENSEAFQQTETGKALQKKTAFDSLKEIIADEEESNGKTEAAPLLDVMSKTEPISTSCGGKSNRIFRMIADAAAKESNDQDENETKSAAKPQQSLNAVDSAIDTDIKDEFGPYQSNLNYLEDQIKISGLEVLLKKLKSSLENEENEDSDASCPLPGFSSRRGGSGRIYDEFGCAISKDDMKRKQETQAQKMELKVKKMSEKIRIKLRATHQTPRLEQLVEALHLESFEKFVILQLLKKVIMPPDSCNYGCAIGDPAGKSIGNFIEAFATSLEDKMKCRKFFYKSSTLIQEGILSLSATNFMTDLTKCTVELDRRMFDFLVGLDTEFSEIVDGSHLYAPDVSLEDVVLPTDVKSRIFDCVDKFDEVKDKFEELNMHEKVSYGLGQVLLFYGQSGTGKTMLANAIATKMKRKILLVNFPSLGTNTSGELIKFLFREARINKALLFFDECESLFKSRNKGGDSVNMILTELERFDGLCIMATNRPMDLDEAMYRRITLSVEFKKPDHIAREAIFKKLHPPKLHLDDDVDFNRLARKYELTGGLIKNVWIQSIGLMVQRGDNKVTQEDLVQAASEQVIGRLSLDECDRGVVPTSGIDSVVAEESVHESLNSIVQYTKAQTVLFGSWGFGKLHRASEGISALFCGPPGTGKTMAAEAISFDLGKPLKVVNMAELVSKWVGETGKNIQAVFDDAKSKDAVLVFDEAEGLIATRSDSSTGVSRHDNMNVGLLLQHIESFSGVVIAITNKKSAVDEAFFRRFNFVVHFEPPSSKLRLSLWESMVPEDCPVAPDVELKNLASRYELCGGDIKSALFRAATRAALRDKAEERVVSMKDLEDACEEEIIKYGDRKASTSMYV